ncbi:hypothetical protein GOP47_0002489 [Adiantum capillus-veneris]|uniref:DUF220 domain-containing protein n=1 Tax=Adiantum capillus-veneris TaxID=13818 RepID=A0A9D4VBP2_ADICA|nr:hypothetical protein GOP47_0002489 [Adiantum capillus-veneris]
MASETALDGVDGDGRTHVEDDAWTPLEFVHEPPVLTVTQPKGSFCQIDARFSVPLPPDDVYNIITDPNNRRVFKNIKEVTYRKVLQDDGNKQLVEVEQLGRWRFLMISGTFSCRVLVEQDRKQHTMIFDLVKQGMMRKFSGSWKIEAFDPSEASSNGEKSDSKDNETPEKPAQVGSWITFNQVVEPAIVPPWPLNGYVRGVTAKIVREILGDLQRECIHLAEMKQGNAEGASGAG